MTVYVVLVTPYLPSSYVKLFRDVKDSQKYLLLDSREDFILLHVFPICIYFAGLFVIPVSSLMYTASNTAY